MAAAASPIPVRLSPLEGLMPRVYIRQFFCFPTADLQAIDTLSRGVSGLARDVPYVLSRVLRNESGNTISAPCHSAEDIFSWHDLSDSIDYATLKAGHFAPDAFLAEGLIPPDTVPPYPASPAVFLARASLVNGGLILCVAVHHVTTDITGLGALLKIWASHCRDGSSRNIEFDTSWLSRSPLFSASESSPSPASMPSLLHIRTPEESRRAAGRSQAGGQKSYQTGIFYFSLQHLRALKDAVNAHVAVHEPGSWVSTGDILTSLLWSATIAAQSNPNANRTGPYNTRVSSTLSFPVQFRSLLRPPLPRDFLGAAFLMTSARVPHEDVCLISSYFSTKSTSAAHNQPAKSEPQEDAEMEELVSPVHISALAGVALAIRQSVQKIDDAAVRGVLAYLETCPNTPNPEAPLVLGPPRCEAGGTCTSVVSWADQCAYELDWGDIIGRCDAVRLAKMMYERDPIVLPQIHSVDGDAGGVEVIMSYEADVMQRIVEGPVMKRFAVLRCLS
ncbi:hypothetical protein F4678DRAFT_450263 [Xylaria arbuscula]|nr:hypothetical protein F4678DRAFT_450263 [Xylaria arbuscula]